MPMFEIVWHADGAYLVALRYTYDFCQQRPDCLGIEVMQPYMVCLQSQWFDLCVRVCGASTIAF